MEAVAQWRTCLVFVLASFVVLCGAQQQSQFQLSVPPSDLRVDSNGTVFVAAGNELLRLDGDFVEQERIEPVEDASIQRIALSQDESRVVVCLDDESCAVYNASNLAAGAQLTRAGATSNTEDVTLFTSPGDSFYAGSYGTVSSTNQIYLIQYGFGGTEFSRALSSNYNGNQRTLVRRFYGGFVLGLNAYYIVYDGNPSDVRGIRVLRVCDFDLCPGGTESCDITALYEAELVCSGSFGAGTAICGVSLLSNFDSTPGNRVVVSLCEPFRNRICSFDLSMVDTAMDSVYDTCVNSPGPAITSPVWLSASTCSSFEATSNCAGFITPPALSTPSISETLHVDLENTVDRITSTLALTVDGSTILYVGYTDRTDTSVHFVGRYHITSDSSDLGLGDLTVVAGTTSAVRHLQWVEGMEYIYVATEEEVFRIPLEQCSTFEDCDSCAGDSNPLCGWCTVESKCSRSSECTNSSQPMRWVQETAECIASVADPATFVLDNPQNITVTVTQGGLPPPLNGESYECYFETAGGESFFTDAVEVTTNTQYMCDLTQTMIPSFQGASLVTDFSFRSTAIGIPFATEEGAVTVYDCPEANSCSECLQTQNACGWCIFNKQCSGTSEPCLNSNETFFLSPGGGETFVDVCPLLEPGSFTGEYVQPVAIERNIILITSNLPEPIMGFGYECMIGNIALNAEYINDTTFNCIVTANELQLPAGDNDGRDREPVRIVWRSDDGMITHNIDTRGGAPINALLYNCNGVASSCSACLASSIGTGLECAWLNPSNSCVIDTTPAVTTDDLQCPNPVITAISPTMGPLQGGTAITITGTGLGTMFSDVDGRVMINGQPCATAGQEEGYVPGLEIVCETPNLGTAGDFTIMVTLPRENENATASSPVAFTTVTPSVTGVEPGFGPVAGGTRVRVMGTSLGFGNVEDTTVTVNSEECIVENPFTDISATEIICISAAFSGDSSQCMSSFTGDTSECDADTPSDGTCPSFSNPVPVEVSIDAFSSQPSGVSYNYRCDPTFSRVCPAETITAGGIRLTFFGCNLDVAQEPILIVTVGRRRQAIMAPCTVTSATAIECLAPDLNAAPGSMVSYIIMSDGATFSAITEELQITVAANPVFSSTAVDEDYTEDSNATIQITGTNLLNAQPSEYVVTVGGEECMVVAVTEMLLLCTPPQQPPNGQDNTPVVVMVGQNLNYPVGTLTYTTSAVPVNINNNTIAIAVGVSAGSVLILSILVVLLIAIYIFIYRRRSSVTLREKGLEEVQLQPVVIPNSPHPLNEFLRQLPQKLVVASDQLQLLNSIGQGEFGVVYKAYLINWQGHKEPQLVAAKTLKVGLFGTNDESMKDEILKMQDFHHPHVMSLLGVYLDSTMRLSIIMPYMANGSLLDYLKKERAHLVLSDREDTDLVCSVQKLLLSMCYQVAQGMEYLAEQKFVHRDLAARNCMLNGQGDIKVADFGLSEDMYATGYFRQANVDATVKLPYKWMSPESLEDGLFSEKSDVWAFGVTCWEIFTGGKIPYPAVDPTSLMKLLENGQRLEKPSNVACSRKIYSVMQRCWLDDPGTRPSFSDLVVSLSPLLESVAGYTQLSMTLTQPGAADLEYEVMN